MFSTVRLFIKTSIVFLFVGLASGVFMMAERDLFERGYGPEMVTAHAHLILLGSVMMMIMGVALWFFPRPEKGDIRYRPGLIRTTYWMMASATAARFIAQATFSFIPGRLCASPRWSRRSHRL